MDEPVTVGELFDPDDVVARWVFSLTAAVEDLSITQSLFKNALDADAPLHKTGALLRLLMVRMLEAERPIIATQHHDGVRAFIDDVPEAAEPLAFLRDMFLERPCTCSKVREAFGDVRHRTVHHSWVGGDELRGALVDAADEDARIIVSRSAGTLHFEWPEAVATRVLFGDLTDPKVGTLFRGRQQVAQAMLNRYAQLKRAVLTAYLDRVGIDEQRLIHFID